MSFYALCGATNSILSLVKVLCVYTHSNTKRANFHLSWLIQLKLNGHIWHSADFDTHIRYLFVCRKPWTAFSLGSNGITYSKRENWATNKYVAFQFQTTTNSDFPRIVAPNHNCGLSSSVGFVTTEIIYAIHVAPLSTWMSLKTLITSSTKRTSFIYLFIKYAANVLEFKALILVLKINNWDLYFHIWLDTSLLWDRPCTHFVCGNRLNFISWVDSFVASTEIICRHRNSFAWN